jgi:hypothetical protein
MVRANGIIIWSFVDPNRTNRAEPKDIVNALQKIQ